MYGVGLNIFPGGCETLFFQVAVGERNVRMVGSVCVGWLFAELLFAKTLKLRMKIQQRPALFQRHENGALAEMPKARAAQRKGIAGITERLQFLKQTDALSIFKWRHEREVRRSIQRLLRLKPMPELMADFIDLASEWPGRNNGEKIEVAHSRKVTREKKILTIQPPFILIQLQDASRPIKMIFSDSPKPSYLWEKCAFQIIST